MTEPRDETPPSYTIRRKSYIISIWTERQPAKSAVWRGYLETTSGQRSYFASISELVRLLTHLSGWVDTPEP